MTPTLIALLPCRSIERDDGGALSVLGIHDRQIVPSLPAQVRVALFVRYSGVSGPHRLTLRIRDRETGQVGPSLSADADPGAGGDFCDVPFQFELNVRRPTRCTLHVIVGGTEIGSCYYAIDALPAG